MSHTLRFTFKFILALLGAFLWANCSTAYAAESTPPYQVYLPVITRQADMALTQFAVKVANGDDTAVRGLYVAPTMAFPVEQQPADNPMYVTDKPDTATQYQLAELFDVVGLLAHNTLAGAHFSHLATGQVLYLIYGDGSIHAFRVIEIKRYRTSDGNTFTDVEMGGGPVYQSGMFMQVYTHPGTLVLQTCLEFPGDAFLGRLFIIAEPIVN
jgi:hypothetical protein